MRAGSSGDMDRGGDINRVSHLQAIMELEGISYEYYDRFKALEEVDLIVEEGTKMAIVGANGSGKSTLLQVMGGILFPKKGRVLFRKELVTEASLRDPGFRHFFRSRVGYVFQDPDIQLFCPTVIEELMFGPLQLGLPHEEARSRSQEILAMLSLEGLAHRPTYMLSGGEKKKVAMASVLTMNPELLLLDEPTNGLDPRTQSFLVDLIFSLHEAGKTIVIATHDLSLVMELHARVAVLTEEHRICKVGDSEEIIEDEALLLKANLIHEHTHKHNGEKHSHLHGHFLFHRHT